MPDFPWLYRTLRAPIRAALGRWFDLRIEGLEHLPATGPYIVAANHHNYLDGVVLGVAVPAPIAFIVMPRVWRATWLHPVFHRHIGSIPINLERPDFSALRSALSHLERGGVVGIFPEGPFSVRGRLERGLPGVALLALRSGVPVVPAALHGTYEALRHRRFYLPRPTPLDIGIQGWLETFGRSFFEQFEEPERGRVFAEVVELLRPSLCDADGVWTADHIRLRFAAERVS